MKKIVAVNILLLTTLLIRPALANYNEINLKVTESFKPYCGNNWIPSMANRLSTGYVSINGERVLDFDLRNQEHCDRIETFFVDVPGETVIPVNIHIDDNGGFDMAANLTTWPHDRIWNVNFDNVSAWGEVVDTDWDNTGRLRPF